MNLALWLPIFDDLADPRLVAHLAAEAEEAGWDGMFVWDHLRWREPIMRVADPWITLTAIATATERLRLGPMVSAIARRRPAKLARETATLDLLSDGRLTLGVGLGSDRFAGEFSRTGDETDDRVRAEKLDETLEILKAAWSGETVHHHGEHHTIDGIQFLPARPGIPLWAAGFPGRQRPMRRAARLDGYFPVNLGSPDEFAEAVAQVEALREDRTRPFDYVAEIEPGDDPARYPDATWCLTAFDPETVSVDHVRGVLRDGPAVRS